MSENQNDTSVEPVVEDVQAEVPTDPAVEATEPETNTVPETIPYARLAEVVAQREQARLEAERAAFEVQRLRDELARLAPPQPAAQQQMPWDTYTDPNAKALAQLVYQVNQHSQKEVNAKLARFEAVAENLEATNFWARYPQVPVEMQQKANNIYAQAKHLGIDRDTALTFAYGEAARQQTQANLAAAAASTQQQAQVNRTARAGVVPPGATPATTKPTQPITKASDLLRQIEADTKTRR